MRFGIGYTESALADLERLDARWRRRILDTVDRMLVNAPAKASRNRKLVDLQPPEVEGKFAEPRFWQWVAKRQHEADDRSRTVTAAEARRRLLTPTRRRKAR